MSKCNYCNWQSMKRQGYRMATAKERKELWDREADSEGFSKTFGAGVVIVTKDGRFASWMMELPKSCCC